MIKIVEHFLSLTKNDDEKKGQKIQNKRLIDRLVNLQARGGYTRRVSNPPGCHRLTNSVLDVSFMGCRIPVHVYNIICVRVKMKISFYSRRLLGAVIVKNKLDRLWRT